MQYYLHCQQKDNSHVKIAYQIEGVDPNKHGGIVERSSGTTQDHGVGPPESNDQSHLASSQKPPGINDTVKQHRIMVLEQWNQMTKAI